MWTKRVAAFLIGIVLFSALPVAQAQTVLDENCVVSVLNRTAQVKPDGTYAIPNTPANFGQVRARATCVQNGLTVSGQSGFFNVPANGVIVVGDIPLGVVSPVPQSLTVSSGLFNLTAVGATTPLTVTGQFADGTSQNLSLGTSGTSYNSSNPLIATVSADGLVTAGSSGTVMLSATNDGTLGMTRLQVILSVDTDGDGIPDDIELFNGLDPNNPIDALEDPDKDGLTNREELIDFGTNHQNPDTDGDGIKDGEEVILGTDGFITDPLLADTDGDGLRDGLEIQTGSDPTVNTSFNLASALLSIAVSPPSFTITYNTIVGEASEQLSVTGNLMDGTTIDLTATQQGSNYNSSDVTICSFGVTSGQVFSGSVGSCTITVSNNGFTATSIGIIQSFAPRSLSTLPIPGYANDVDVDGSYAYVAAGSAGLQVVDIRDKINPKIIASLDTPGIAIDVKVAGNFAYIADGSSGLQIIDVTNPMLPVSAGSVDTLGVAQALVVSGTRAYVADGAGGLVIIDIANQNMTQVTSTEGTAKGVAVSADLNYILVTVDDPGVSAVKVIDISDENNPLMTGTVLIPGTAKDLVVQGTYAYVAAFLGGFQIVDFSTPAIPQIVGGIPLTETTGIAPRDVGVPGSFALFAEQLFVNSTPIVNIDNPFNPVLRDTLFSSLSGTHGGTGIAVTQEFVYVTEANDSVADDFRADPVIGVTTRLFIGQYLAIEDKAGLPPTIQITSPLLGETLYHGAAQLIEVDAADDVAVVSVDFIVDGSVVFTDTAAPYEYVLNIPTNIAALTIGATTIDFGGNMGVASDIQYNVTPDPGTTVVGNVVDDVGLPAQGASVTTRNGLSGSTAMDGTFSISGEPTIFGDIQVTTSFTTTDLRTLEGTSASVPPVVGGATDVGQIQVGLCVPPISGLVSRWSAEGDATDRIASNHGTLFNDVAFAPGVVGQAFSFDGDLDGDFDVIVVNDATSLDITGPLTLETWVKINAFPLPADFSSAIVWKGNSLGQSASSPYAMLLLPDGTVEGILGHGTGGFDDLLSTTVLPLNTFAHIALVATGLQADAQFRLYINGQLDASVTQTFDPHNTISTLQFGSISQLFNGNVTFDGLIDEIALYNVALTPQQILDSYNSGLSGSGLCGP